MRAIRYGYYTRLHFGGRVENLGLTYFRRELKPGDSVKMGSRKWFVSDVDQELGFVELATSFFVFNPFFRLPKGQNVAGKTPTKSVGAWKTIVTKFKAFIGNLRTKKAAK